MTITKCGDNKMKRIKTACCTLAVTVVFNEQYIPIKVLVKNEDGGCTANLHVIMEFVNEYLEEGKVDKILSILKGHNCPSCTKAKEKIKSEDEKKSFPKSCADAIYKIIIKVMEELKDKQKPIKNDSK